MTIDEFKRESLVLIEKYPEIKKELLNQVWHYLSIFKVEVWKQKVAEMIEKNVMPTKFSDFDISSYMRMKRVLDINKVDSVTSWLDARTKGAPKAKYEIEPSEISSEIDEEWINSIMKDYYKLKSQHYREGKKWEQCKKKINAK